MKTKLYDYDQVEMEVDGVRVPVEECAFDHNQPYVIDNSLPLAMASFATGFALASFLFTLAM